MDKDVRCFRSARRKSIPLATIEPFDRRLERRTSGVSRSAQVFGIAGRRSRRIIQREKTSGLQPFGPLHRFADDARAFVSSLEARLADAGLVQKNVPGRAA